MLSYPDFSEKQLLCINNSHVRGLRFFNENLVIEDEGKIIDQASMHKLFAVFVIGNATITTHLIQKLEAFWVSLVCMKDNFEPYVVLGGAAEWNTLLRSKQYALSHAESISKFLAENKIANQQALLGKIREKDAAIKHAMELLGRLKAEIRRVDNQKEILGNEGIAAKVFFSTYYRKIGWTGRTPRTKKNIQNLLLDIGYTFLFHFVDGLLRIYGFDTYKGVYHTDFYQRKSLVCDVMEPFRPLIDNAMLKAYGLSQVNPKDFAFCNGTFLLKPEARQKYARIFSRAILNEKEAMYRYVQTFYRHFMDDRTSFPFYSFETHQCSSFPTT